MSSKKTPVVEPFDHDTCVIGTMPRRDVSRLVHSLVYALEEGMDDPRIEVRLSNGFGNNFRAPEARISVRGGINQATVQVEIHEEWVVGKADEPLPEFATNDLAVIRAALRAAVSEYYAPNSESVFGGYSDEDFERVLNSI